MKRPMLIAVLALTHGELTVTKLQDAGLFVVMTFILVILLTYSIAKKKYAFLVLYVFFFIFGMISMLKIEGKQSECEKIQLNEEVSFIGEVKSLKKGNYADYILIESEGVTLQLRLTDDMNISDYRVGNKVSVKANNEGIDSAKNEGQFDERMYLYSNQILLKLVAKDIEVVDFRYNEFKQFTDNLKIKSAALLDEICDEKTAGIYKAILFGERDEIDGEIKELYSDGGISHILAVSGLHISIIGMGVFQILRRFFDVKSSGVASLLVMILYGILVGETVSAYRAIIMFSINLVSKILGCPYDIKESISIAAFLLLIKNPYYIFNTSFLLSFGAVVCIAFIIPYAKEFLEIKRNIAKGILSSVAICIFTGPIVANVYYEIAIYQCMLNVIVIPLMSVVVISGIIAIIIAYISTDIAGITIVFGKMVLKLYEILCSICVELPFYKVVCGHFSDIGLVSFYTGITFFTFFMYLEIKKRKKDGRVKVKRGIFLVTVIILSAFICVTFPEKSVYKVLDVGQGACMIYVSERGNVYVFDAGSSSISDVGEKIILKYLKYSGIKHIDFLVLSHSDADHISGVCDIFEDNVIDVRNIIIPYNDEGFAEIINEYNVKITYGNSNLKIEDNNVNIEFVNPIDGMEYADVNEGGLVCFIDTGKVKIGIMADIGNETEKMLAKEGALREVDVLMAAHHGSKNSSCKEALDILKPDIAVISCGEDNAYGHPHSETLERLKAIGCDIYNTATDGAVEIRIGEELSVNVYSR